MSFPVLVNVATALIGDVLPMAVLGNEKPAGSTLNCDEAGAGVTPKETAPEPDDGVVALGAATVRGSMRQAAVNAIDVSITAIESQWLQQRSI
jgi:hypothetical protein